jgi:intron-binding protein aquarius
MAMDHEMAERTDCRTLWKSTKYDKKAVEKIYCHLKDGLTDPHLLESTYYLEKYLLPFYDSKSSKAHILSILAVFNEKLRLGLRSFEMLSDAFPSLFGKSLDFFLQGTIFEQNIVLQFLNHTFTFMDIGFVKTECVKIVNISCWKSLVSQEALEDQLSQSPDRQKLWDKAEKRFASGKYIFIVASGSSRERLIFEHGFLSHLIKNFLKQLYSFDGALLSLEVVSYIEAVLEFMLTLLSQLSTRRHFIVLFQDHLVMPLCIRSGFLRKYNEQNTLACQLMKLLSAYASFGVDDITGLQQSAEEVAQIRNERIVEMQKLAFMNMRSELELFVFASASTLKDAKSIRGTFEKCSDDVIVRFCDLLKIRTLDVATGTLYPREFLIEFIVWNLKTHETQFDWINSEPLYPDEVMIFDDTRVPSLALQKPYKSAPILKLTAQYLTIGDYLLRNFVMYKSEYAYALRKDIQEAVLRLSPSFNLDGTSQLDRTLFRGWSRNAIPIEQVTLFNLVSN